MPTTITEDLKLNRDSGKIELFDLDLTALGGPVYRVTNQPAGDLGYVSFGGQAYYQFPMEFSGVAISTEGSSPRATLRAGTVQNLMLKAALNQYGLLLGMKITRRVTYAKYLDTGSSPNSSYHSVPETWVVSKLVEQNNTSITWECSLPFDMPNVVFPPGQFLKVPSNNPWDCWAPGMNRL